jgi:hypothetical protein
MTLLDLSSKTRKFPQEDKKILRFVLKAERPEVAAPIFGWRSSVKAG